MSVVQRVSGEVQYVPLEEVVDRASVELQLVFEEHVSQAERISVCFNALLGRCCQEDLGPLERSDLGVLSQLTDTVGRSALLHVIYGGDRPCAQRLIGNESLRRVFVCTVDPEGNTPLHAAIENGDLILANELLKYIDIHCTNKRGLMPLHIAIRAGKPECVDLLLRCGTTVNRPLDHNTLEVRPFTYAILCGELECCKTLCDNSRIQFDSEMTQLGTILHAAIHFQQRSILEWMLQNDWGRRLLETRNLKGFTPIQYAAFLDDPEAVMILHRFEANIEAGDNHLWTPLHIAARHDHRNTIETLVYLGSRLDATDEDLRRPVDLVPAEARSTKARLLNLMRSNRVLERGPPDFSFVPPENIVFKGGGPKGIAYVGTMQALEQRSALTRLKRVAGTSAGAINAVLLAFNVNSNEMGQMVDQNFNEWLDHPFKLKSYRSIPGAATAYGYIVALRAVLNQTREIVLNRLKALWSCTGICQGEVFRTWIEGEIYRKSGEPYCTFGQLRQKIRAGQPFKHLHVFATKLNGPNGPEIVRFSSEDTECDEIIISDAIRASMSIPVVFVPHTLHKKNSRGERDACPSLGSFVDGGMIYNFPIQAFDEKRYVEQGFNPEEGSCPVFNKRTLGVSLGIAPTASPDVSPVETVSDLVKALITVYKNAESVLYRTTPYNQYRVIDVDNRGVGLLDFGLSMEKKQELIDSGKQCTEQFYKKYKESLAMRVQTFHRTNDVQPSAETLLQSQNTRGLYFVATCKNEKCGEPYKRKLIYQGLVIAPRSVHMHKAVCTTLCPCCSQKGLMFEGVAFKSSACTWEGKKKIGEASVEDRGEWEGTEVREQVVSLAQDWEYLEITRCQ